MEVQKVKNPVPQKKAKCTHYIPFTKLPYKKVNKDYYEAWLKYKINKYSIDDHDIDQICKNLIKVPSVIQISQLPKRGSVIFIKILFTLVLILCLSASLSPTFPVVGFVDVWILACCILLVARTEGLATDIKALKINSIIMRNRKRYYINKKKNSILFGLPKQEEILPKTQT